MQEPVARDFENVRITPDQIRKINYALDQVDLGRFSYQYLKELVELGRRSLKKAFNDQKEERAAELGAEIQIWNHVLNVCYSRSGTKVKEVRPDPEHLKVLAIVDGRVCPAGYTLDTWVNLIGAKFGRGESWDILKHYGENCLACNKNVANIDPALVATKGLSSETEKFLAKRFPPLPTVTQIQQQAAEQSAAIADDALNFLPADVRKDIDPVSSNPQIAAAQSKVRKLIEELTFAMEDREPPYIISKLQSKLGTAHEQLVTLRQQLGSNRSRRM